MTDGVSARLFLPRKGKGNNRNNLQETRKHSVHGKFLFPDRGRVKMTDPFNGALDSTRMKPSARSDPLLLKRKKLVELCPETERTPSFAVIKESATIMPADKAQSPLALHVSIIAALRRND